MHTGPLAESAGTFLPALPKLYTCPHCRGLACVTVTPWESNCGAYEDEKHECSACGKVWWVEGIDA